ncbi:hypothetical protein [Streptomyces venezuelae]|uniref:hypothetical protein n=1 Tax=Streptomyces venezuelae TaxID=54571 RepID=UPI00364712BB
MSGRRRMATLGAVHDAEPAVRRPHDVIAPPGGRGGGQYIPRPGPKAQAKRLCASVVYDAEHVMRQVFETAQARDQEHRRRWVILVDGAQHQLALAQAEARLRNVKVHIVIDVVRVLEYLRGAAFSFHVRYETALASGWPIATGIVEGAAPLLDLLSGRRSAGWRGVGGLGAQPVQEVGDLAARAVGAGPDRAPLPSGIGGR